MRPYPFPLPIESPAQRVSIGEEKSICKGAFRLPAECGICKAYFDELVGQNGLAFLRESHAG